MAVVANQALAFDKSMLMACPHLGDVLRPGLILDHGLSAPYCLLLRPESPCRRGPLDLAIEIASKLMARQDCTGRQE